MSVKPAVLRRLMRELQELETNPPEGIRVQTNEENMLDIIGIIQGPEGTPYANGYFKVKFHFTEEFPAAPPKCRMLTKIFHPNFSTAGEICVNTLKKDWQSSFGISHILVTIKCLLIHPNPESALDEEAGKLLLENYDDYCSRARLITSVHAKARPAVFADVSVPVASSSKGTSSGGTDAASASGTKVATTVPKSSSCTTTPVGAQTLPPIVAMAGEAPATATVTTQRVVSASHASENSEVSTSVKDVTKGKVDRQSPAPLGTNDGNVAANKTRGTAPASKAVKRVATAASGVEKKKKALKRL